MMVVRFLDRFFFSSISSTVDEDGLRHLLLCRVIVGKAEEIPAGSNQFHPTSEEFDSGVDNLLSPNWFVIWPSHMNTHILPEFVVSFRTSPDIPGMHLLHSPCYCGFLPQIKFRLLSVC